MKRPEQDPSTKADLGKDRSVLGLSAARWLLAIIVFILLLGGVRLTTLTRGKSPLLADPRFVVTTKPTFGVPSSAPFRARVFVWWMRLREEYAKPHPLSYSFGASPAARCSIHGLLNQCMEVGGVRYVIAKDVAAGSVMFGPTNTLNGAQWVKAFTEALQTGQPEWWDSHAQKFRKENLVLLTNDARTVLVLPKDMAGEFQPKAAR